MQDKEFNKMAAFPTSSDAKAWMPVVLHVAANLPEVFRTPDVDQAIQDLDGFPGWDHWGHIKSRGQDYPKARRDMSFAMSRLRDEGKLHSPKRGSFSLTFPEVTEAPVTEAPVTEAPEVAARAQVIEIANHREGPVNHPVMEADEALRARIIEDTKCFGYWSNLARHCKGCPLAGFCHDAVEARKVAHAAVLGYSDAQADHPEPVVHQEPVAPVVHQEPVETPTGGETTTASFPVFCRKCRGSIPAGEEFIRVNGTGNFHKGCV